METLVSTWSGNVKALPENYIFPPESRPGSLIAPLCDTIPVVCLKRSYSSNDRKVVIQQILEASREYGFFQVIGHGVSEELTRSTMSVFEEFFTMPAEDKDGLCTDKPKDYNSSSLYTSSVNYATEQVHLWRDNLRHPCHPLDESMPHWPEKPSRYRSNSSGANNWNIEQKEVVGAYSVEARKLGLRILELICEGLELESGYFEDELTSSALLSVNRYPLCPDPSLALGLSKHSDPNLITILLQDDVYGLQVLKDGQWFGVEPIPNAFVVNIGYQLQIVTNGKLRSAQHRVVTNSRVARTSCALFINPSGEGIIEPAKALISDENPQLYRSFRYKEFLINYTTNNADDELALAPFMYQT